MISRPSPLGLIEAAWLDVRYARRVLWRTPAFTLTAILTLALAIGVNTAVFALVDAILLKPLPYPHPERLALLTQTVKQGGQVSSNPAVDGRTWEFVRDHVTSADRAVFSDWTTGVNLVVRGSNGTEQARFVQQQRVSTGFFSVLGVPMLAGREFTADEDRAGGPSGRRPERGTLALGIRQRSIRGRAVPSRSAANPTPSSASCPRDFRPGRAPISGRRCGPRPRAKVAGPTTRSWLDFATTLRAPR